MRRDEPRKAAFVPGAVSVTLALAALASQSVDVYGALIGPALPVSSLTRNVARTTIATLGLLGILSGLGLSITPMLTALGVGGHVVDFSWWSTRLRMLANNLIVVPNARVREAAARPLHR